MTLQSKIPPSSSLKLITFVRHFSCVLIFIPIMSKDITTPCSLYLFKHVIFETWPRTSNIKVLKIRQNCGVSNYVWGNCEACYTSNMDNAPTLKCLWNQPQYVHHWPLLLMIQLTYPTQQFFHGWKYNSCSK